MRRALHCVGITAFFLCLIEAYLRWQVYAASRSTASWKPLPVIEEADLNRDAFYNEYVLKQRPVIIRLGQPDPWNSTRALEHCGSQKSTHISGASYNFLKEARHWWWIRIPFEWIFLPLLGMWTTLDKQLQIRIDVPFASYVSYAEQHDDSADQTYFLGLPLFITRSVPMKLLLMLDYFKRPRYLHDIPLQKVCEPALDWIHVPKYVTPNWWFLGFQPGMSESNERQFLDEPTFFFGGAHSAGYGLHQNIRSDFDFFLMVLQGKKRYAIYDPTESNINSLKIWPDMNVPLFVANPFNPDLVATPDLADAKGWMGYLKAGEILYSPGDSIHSFENADFERPTVAVKFWYASHTKVCGEEPSEDECRKYFGIMGMPSRHTDSVNAPTLRKYTKDGLRKRKKETIRWQEQRSKSWETAVDPESGQTFYYNAATGETTWDRPDVIGQAEL